jgi:hypothetical protein
MSDIRGLLQLNNVRSHETRHGPDPAKNLGDTHHV